MKVKILFFNVIILLLSSTYAVAFQNKSTNKDKAEYKALSDQFYDYRSVDSLALAQLAAETYLNKAKSANDSLKIAYGFFLLSKIAENVTSHKYSDSVILFSKDIGNPNFPLLAYRAKANLYYDEYNFKKSFDYFFKVTEEAKKHQNKKNLFKGSHGATLKNKLKLYYHQSIRDMILIKAHVGEHETGLKNLKKCYAYFSEIKNERPEEYFSTAFALADSYTHLKKLDSATIINQLGYQESYTLKIPEWRHNFVLNEGVNQLYKGNYKAAKDSLLKSIPAISNSNDPVDAANVSMAYYYLGKTLSEQGDEDEALKAHKKVDEIYQKTGMVIPQIRGSYDVLIDHFKKNGDKDNHLKYIERRLAIDSSLTSDYKYLIKNVVHKYDTPRLLYEKQEIIDSLQKDKKSSTVMNIILVIISVLFLVFWVHNYLKRRDYKKKFNELYNSTTVDQSEKRPIVDQDSTDEIGIADDIIEDILDKLEEFEDNKDFLQSDITTNSLSKKFNTNYKYLSKIVNRYKNKSFSSYINDLRIDYSVTKLKEDKKFKHYTMKAIANEVGFNTSQAYSKSFYKKNGIHPSYFIKELQKKES